MPSTSPGTPVSLPRQSYVPLAWSVVSSSLPSRVTRTKTSSCGVTVDSSVAIHSTSVDAVATKSGAPMVHVSRSASKPKPTCPGGTSPRAPGSPGKPGEPGERGNPGKPSRTNASIRAKPYGIATTPATSNASTSARRALAAVPKRGTLNGGAASVGSEIGRAAAGAGGAGGTALGGGAAVADQSTSGADSGAPGGDDDAASGRTGGTGGGTGGCASIAVGLGRDVGEAVQRGACGTTRRR